MVAWMAALSLCFCFNRMKYSGHVTTIAGSFTASSGYANGLGTAALLAGNQFISISTAGNVYLCDNNMVRVLDTTGQS
jgi:hypothetical protein